MNTKILIFHVSCSRFLFTTRNIIFGKIWSKIQNCQFKLKFDTKINSYMQNSIRHFSHVTKSRIFKNLNLRRKTNCDLCDNLLKNHFRYLKLYSIPQADWPEVVVIWTGFERQKIEVHIFERANLSAFAAW